MEGPVGGASTYQQESERDNSHKKETRDGGFGGKEKKAFNRRGGGVEQTPPLCPCAVQKCSGLMGAEDTQPPVGYTSNYTA